MNLQSWNKDLIIRSAVMLCIGFIFAAAAPSLFAEPIFFSSGYSEVLSHWSTPNNYYSESGGSYLEYSYSAPNLPAGSTFDASVMVNAEFGQMKLYGSFSESLPAGSNHALVEGSGFMMWLNTPLSVNVTMSDVIRVNGQEGSSYDIVIPIWLEGEFNKSGSDNCIGVGCSNSLGLTGEASIYATLRNAIGGPYFRSSDYLIISEDEFSSDLYYLTLPGIPANTDLRFQLRPQVAFDLIDTIDYTNQLHADIDLSDPNSVNIERSVNMRDDYSLSGEADFSNTVSFGSFLVYSNGVRQPDVTIASADGDAIYTAVPEPTSLLLLGTGLGVLGLAVWHKRK